ncbi:protein C3orf33 [Prorops nasuta]|uniref:protein C3orf33 n=1 Tax=Prorops nasuta TaxID=863751 RepID=UPI0034CE9F98
MEDKENTTLFQLTKFLQEEAVVVKNLTYGVSGVALLCALYKIRPLAKFQKPHKIPTHFVKNQTPLKGTVMSINPSQGTLLMVDHKPLIPIPRFGKQIYLPVKIAGLSITGNGIAWLQSIIQGKTIIFHPLIKHNEFLECIVTLPQKEKENFRIAEALVKLGFARTNNLPADLLKDKRILLYQSSLLLGEKLAQRNRNGYWQFAIPPTHLWKLQMQFLNRVNNLLPVFLTKGLNH